MAAYLIECRVCGEQYYTVLFAIEFLDFSFFTIEFIFVSILTLISSFLLPVNPSFVSLYQYGY